MAPRFRLSLLSLLSLILIALLLVLSGVVIYVANHYRHIDSLNNRIQKMSQEIEAQLKVKDQLMTRQIKKKIQALKSDQSVQDMTQEIKNLEEVINQKGETYNQMVRRLNQSLNQFPKNIIAGWARIKKASPLRNLTPKQQQ